MMERFEKPTIEVIRFEAGDVIATSVDPAAYDGTRPIDFGIPSP